MKFCVEGKLNIWNPRFYVSILLGIIFGLAVYSYWLVNIFPLTSPKIFVFSIFAGLMGTFGYFALLDLWIIPYFIKLQKTEKQKLILLGILIGLVLMFAGTSAWTLPTQYLNFLLPSQSLKITVPASEGGITPEVSILWMTTSLGDVSYDKMNLDGWVRDKDHLILKKRLNNITWQGQTGDETLILFRKSPAGGLVTISWNGETETIDLSSSAIGTFQYNRQLKVPFYASFAAVWLVVLVNFVMIGIAICILFFTKKSVVEESVKKSVEDASVSATQWKPAVEISIVVIIFFLAFLLRVLNLGNLYPYADEYLHLIAAKGLFAGAPLNSVYQRSLFVVTLPVVASYSVLGQSLWAARLPEVIFNTLGIVPLFLITRRINRQVAILSCLLFAVSPYVIAFSRNIREYAYTPFYFYWVIYLMALFLHGFPDKFVLFRDWRKLQWKHVVLALLLTFPVLYVVVIDRLSTLKLILIAYAVFALFLFSRLDLRNRINKVMLVASSIISFMVIAREIRRFLTLSEVDLRSFEYFFLNPLQQWYFGRLVILPVIAVLVSLYFAFLLRRITLIPILLSVLYIGYMLFFIFFFKETGYNLHPRFVLAAHLWFVPILALGMDVVWRFLYFLLGEKRALTNLSACIFILITFNPRQILLPTFFQGELMPITNLIHDDLGAADEYMRTHVKKDDVLIGSMYASYVQWQGNLEFDKIYPYSNEILKKYKNGFSYIVSVVDQYPSGWIVIDEQRLDYVPPSLPKKQTVIHGKTVEYVGKFLNQYIWRWSVK
ncbi:MAG: hypothetical protein IPP66_05885 [Anaerolineales bacterium]|nr:hypothetical protein [Anaerolineales bacterium]